MLVLRRTLAGLILASIAAFALWAARPPTRIAWERLETGVDISVPPDAGPFPAVVMLHGCGGIRPFFDRYVEAVTGAGAAAVVVDSLAPRGMGRAHGVLTVCSGMRLRGDARARDIALILENLDDPRLDMDRVLLAGWSHGAWAAAELLTEAPEERGVRGGFLVYPYCRFPARWPGRRPPEDTPILAVVPEEDAVGDAQACREALARSGAEVVRVPGATHAFEDDYAIPFPFRHDAEAFAQNRERLAAFVRETVIAPPLPPAGARP